MRRSSRLETATAEKRKTKMSTRLAEHAKRQRRELAGENGDAGEEGEEVEPGGDSDFIASSEEEEDGEEDEEEEDVDDVSRRTTRKRKAAAPLRGMSDSSDQDEPPMKPPLPSAQISKVQSILKKKAITGEQKPKSILKRPKTHSADSSPEKKKAEAKASSVQDAADAHRRPTKLRPATAAGATDEDSRERKEKHRLGSLTKSRGLGGGSSKSIGNTITQFFTEILGWNFHDGLMRQAHKDFAVVTAANDGSEEGEVEISQVPSKFTSYEHYFAVWKPLALEEVQAQTLNAVFTDHPSAISIEAQGAGNPSFLDKTCKIRIEVKKGGAPSQLKQQRKLFDDIFVNDLVLISPNRDYFSRAFRVHSGGGGKNNAHAEQEERDKAGFLGIIQSQRGSREGVTVSVLAHEWRHFASGDGELFAFKLNNLVTSVREFRALCDCANYRLLPLLLSGEHQPGSMQLDSLGLEYVRWLGRTFNESQLEAITAAATSDGFTLIKGPPGTGKTTTLKGLLNSLHLREYNRYYNAVLDVARRPDHETNQAWAKIGNEKPHILVTAPSNAAVDNIVGKIITEGFRDGEGRQYFPKIVRVGRGMSDTVRMVALDHMVHEICKKPYEELQQTIIRLQREIHQVQNHSLQFRDRLREVVAAINLDPVGILANETHQMRLEQERQQQAQQAQQPPPADAPDSPPPAPPIDSPPPPPHTDWDMSSSPPPPVLSPSAPSPLPSFSMASSPPSMPGFPVSPPGYALAPSSPPLPHSPKAVYSSAPSYAFGDEQDEEEDEAFPTTYGPPATTNGSAQEGSSTYNSVATSQAYSAFFDDEDEDMNAEEDEPLPNAVLAETQLKVESAASDHEDEDEAFPPLPIDPPTPDNAGGTDGDSTEEEIVEPAPSSPAPDGSSIKCDPNEAPILPAVTAIDNETKEQIEKEVKEERLSTKTEALSMKDEPPAIKDELAMVKEEPLSVKKEPLLIHAGEGSSTLDMPMSPPPPPPMSPPPPPPPTSPPPPPPPGLPSISADLGSEEIGEPAGGLSPLPKQEGPIVYERYYQYRLVAQQLNSCLERLSELRLEDNRYHLALRLLSENGRPNQQLRQSLEVSFLDTAHIVFTTLSSAGVAALDVSTKYDVLVVDEAAQAVELSSIIPMKFGSRQCVLVGDPQQLSATVFSRNSGMSLYERSLFERLETTGHPVHMLRTQYRSHPLISAFPRHYFYDGRLQDADSVRTPAYNRPYHRLGAGAFMPLVFWNLLSSRETLRSVSRLNVGEAEMAVNLYLTLKNSCPPDSVGGKVGVITPYSQQMDELRNKFRRALGDRFEAEVEINTVDGFQGREKDIIILSTVRADPKAGVGFLNDIRRMNVALTRAKFSCFVIGSESTLRSSKPWSALMNHAREHRCIVHVQDPNCNLLTLRPMELPPGAPASRDRGGPRRHGAKKGFPHQPPPHVQTPPASQGYGLAPAYPHNAAPAPVRRPSPTSAPPEYTNSGAPGPSPTNQAWRGGRGRGAGRDTKRDPRLNGRGGRGSVHNGGCGPGGPADHANPGPPPPLGLHQPPVHHFGPPNGEFRPPPAGAMQLPPGNVAPDHFHPGLPPQHYPAPVAQGHPAQPYQYPPPHHYQQHHHHFAPHQPVYQGPPQPVAFAGPPPGFAQQPPPRLFHDAGRGGAGGRIRDPRLFRQQGGGRGGASGGAGHP